MTVKGKIFLHSPVSRDEAMRHLKSSRMLPAQRRMTMASLDKSPLKRIACADIVPGCSFTTTASTEEDLMKKVAAHASQDHGVTEFTQEQEAKVKAAIKSQ